MYYYFIYRHKKRKEGTAESRWNLWKIKQHDKENLNKAVNAIDFNDVFGEFETNNPLPQVVSKVEKKKNKYVLKDETFNEAINPLHNKPTVTTNAPNQSPRDNFAINFDQPQHQEALLSNEAAETNKVDNGGSNSSTEPKSLPTVNPILYNNMVKKNPLKKTPTTRQVYEVSRSAGESVIEEIVRDIDL